MEIPEQIWLLIARNLSGEASEAERKELAEILRKEEQLQHHYDVLTRVWVEKHSLQNEDGMAAKSSVSRILSKAAFTEEIFQEPAPVIKSRLNIRSAWMAVASIAIFAVGGWFLYQSWFAAKTSQAGQTIEAQRGSRTQSVLPDGSTVWLNAGSKLYYENDFTGASREVRLEGEAFFDVAKKNGQPFIVHAAGIDIKVLGTAFNVKSYPEDKTVQTVLYRGSVKVFRHEESEVKAIQLRPNQTVSLPKEAAVTSELMSDKKGSSPGKVLPAGPVFGHIDSTKKENERIETAWVYNRLEFRGDNFEVLAKKLERWYNVTIVFTDEKVKALSVDGSFEKESVEQAFVALKAGFPITYKINNKEIFVGSAQP